MKKDFICICDTPFTYTLGIIGGKWKMIILYTLHYNNVVRFNELQRLVEGITHKTLRVQLRELEADGLIIRTEYPQIPPKVEYQLSEHGKSLLPIMDSIYEWGRKNKPSKK